MSKKRDVFNIKYVFFILTVYFIFIPFFFKISMDTVLVMLVVLLGCFAFYFGDSLKSPMLAEQKITSKKIKIFFSFLGGAFFILDIFRVVINSLSKIEIGNYTTNFQVSDHESLYLQIFTVILDSAKFYFYSQIIFIHRIVFYMVFLLQIFLYIGATTRLMALFPIIIFTIYGYYMKYIQITLPRIFLLLLAAPILFSYGLLARGNVQASSTFEFYSNVQNSMTSDRFFTLLPVALESFKSFEDLTQIITDNFIHPESGLIRMIFMPISRTIWPDKPEAISRLISKEYYPGQYVEGGGSVATIFGDAFINGHVFGVIVILTALGFFSKVLYKTLIKKKFLSKRQRSVFFMLYALYSFDFLYFYRGFFSEFLWKTILLITVFFTLHKIQFSSKYVNSKRISRER